MKTVLRKVRSASCHARRVWSGSFPKKDVANDTYCGSILELSETANNTTFAEQPEIVSPSHLRLELPARIQENTMVNKPWITGFSSPEAIAIAHPYDEHAWKSKSKNGRTWQLAEATANDAVITERLQTSHRRRHALRTAPEATPNDAAIAERLQSSHRRCHALRTAPEATSNDAAIAERLQSSHRRCRALRTPSHDVASDAAIVACLAATEQVAGEVHDLNMNRQHIEPGPSCPANPDLANDAAIAACLAAMEQGNHGNIGLASQGGSSQSQVATDAAIVACLATFERVSTGDDGVILNRHQEDRIPHSSLATEVGNDAAIAACLAAMEQGSIEGDAPNMATQIGEADAASGAGHPAHEVPEDDECVACLDLQPGVCLIPCGHVCLCVSCADKLSQPRACPMCRMPIEEIVQTGRKAR